MTVQIHMSLWTCYTFLKITQDSRDEVGTSIRQHKHEVLSQRSWKCSRHYSIRINLKSLAYTPIPTWFCIPWLFHSKSMPLHQLCCTHVRENCWQFLMDMSDRVSNKNAETHSELTCFHFLWESCTFCKCQQGQEFESVHAPPLLTLREIFVHHYTTQLEQICTKLQKALKNAKTSSEFTLFHFWESSYILRVHWICACKLCY